MKFIFVDCFDLIWNGYTSRFENGVSGSHNGLLYLAEGIAKISGMEVIITSTVNNIIETEYLGVKYINYDNLNENICDYIITHNDLRSWRILNKIHNFNKIIILTHNELFNYERFFSINKSKIIIAYISEFAKTNILNIQPFLKNYESILLYNSIDITDLPTVDVQNKKNQLCYFACIERGYKLVTEIMKKFENYNLVTNTYANQCKDYFYLDMNNVMVLNNSSKKCTLENVVESKYFVYPLINLENNVIHYDTFAYVVLEALLLGTIVIAPKIGVFEELYGDAICYIETDDIIPKEDLLYWKKCNCNFGYPLIDRYVEMVNRLDGDEELRNSYIRKGLELKYKFCNSGISTNLLSQLTCNKRVEDNLKIHLKELSTKDYLPESHIQYLKELKQNGFEPKVIYDIGSCVLHWTKEAKKLWPDATYILFDAFYEAEFLYEGYDYHIGVLSDNDNNVVKFYQNEYLPAGNSYYREIGCENGKYFPEDKYIEKITKRLDTIVREKGYPLPDFVKIDVQGSEVDIIKGGIQTLKNASRLIVELQHTEYNLGALMCNDSLPIIENLLDFKCISPLFTNNGCDGDYGFINNKSESITKIHSEKVIFTIFSGRKYCLKILVKYLKKSLELKMIDEVHFWNYTKNCYDEQYIKSISNLKRTSSTDDHKYTKITPIVENNSFELNIKASNDIHIKIGNKNIEYEIVLGGWNNTRSVIREINDNGNEIFSLMRNYIADDKNYNSYKVKIINDVLCVFKNNELLMNVNIQSNFEINEVFFKTGYNSVGHLTYNSNKNNGFYFMDTCSKENWKNYYYYYDDKTYENDIIIKCDDDIVFIDLLKLPNFIKFVKENDHDLVFANIINNGVCAFFQQNRYNLIPKDLMYLEYPNYNNNMGFRGSLWENGIKAEKLHKYFIENYTRFIDNIYNNEHIKIKSSFSINFFALKGKKWNKIVDSCSGDDEYNLTVNYVINRNFTNILYTEFIVSHLSFYQQNNTGINLYEVIKLYKDLYSTIEKSGRFIL